MNKEFNIENYKCTDEQLIYWINLLNTRNLGNLIDRIDKVTENIFECSKLLNSEKSK